ncbi:MAG: four-carbon acid sugar kinase family protein, partial [Actinomycetota bacterium]
MALDRQWLVAADDRTGAFEVAALFAAITGSGPVVVTVGEAAGGDGVVDLGTRAMQPGDARAAASAIETPGVWAGHKIDSTLRGNWPLELRARVVRSDGTRSARATAPGSEDASGTATSTATTVPETTVPATTAGPTNPDGPAGAPAGAETDRS